MTRQDNGEVAAVDVASLRPIDRDEMTTLTPTEYGRLLDLLRDLRADEWDAPTVCPGWRVRDMVAHLLGAAEANASLRENVRQVLRGSRRVRGTDRTDVDGINEVQIEDRRHLEPDVLVERLAAVVPAAVRGRRRIPAPLRGVSVAGPLGPLTLGHLVDVVYTRDVWMHRVDIATATGRDLVLTADHDARIVADVVREWAATHGRPVTLHLDGPAGGRYRAGGSRVDGPESDGEVLRLDAVAFALAVSGRTPAEGLLAVEVVF